MNVERARPVRCPRCQRETPADSVFCERCAARLEITCPACGSDVSRDARFCRKCGGSLVADQPLPAASERMAPPADRSRSRTRGERRHLTVMFCDLVESTVLGERLDPEDLSNVVGAYQDACGAVIERYEGHIARYEGDGLLAYFGFPHAHEDDAERALRSALDILRAMQELNVRLERQPGVRLALRIGVHTGLVVVGQVGVGVQRETIALGHTMNLAARLEGIADSDSVVISDQTLRLVRGVFVTQDLGLHALKGIARPVRAHRVIRPTGLANRLDSADSSGLVPLVGRTHELGLLLERWGLARERQGQVLLLAGEPGIGKSRLVRELRVRLTGERHTWLECAGSAYHQSSAFHPIVALLRQMLGLGLEDAGGEQYATLERELSAAGAPSDAAPLLGDLLSLPPQADQPALALSREAQRRQTLEAIAAWLTARAERRPTVLVVEDLHWIDPSTLELLGVLIGQVARIPLLLLPTFRPTFAPPWTESASVARLTLPPLTRQEAVVMVHSMTGDATFPATLVDHVVDRTDGVPLFVEELTKNVLESGALGERDDRDERTGAAAELAVPSTLQDSLMARLDRLGTAKETAQLAAVLGREFSFELLEAVSPLKPEPLANALQQLTRAELLYQRGVPPRAAYTFKHALIQDTAYQSLLRRARQEYHARVAEVLETRFSELVPAPLEVLAHHHEEAGHLHEAIGYFEQAGELATRRSANLEAIGHLTRGIELTGKLAAGPERDHGEALLQVALGVPLQASKGYADPAVEGAYRRARELCEGCGELTLEFRALWGLFQHHNSRAQLGTAREVASQLLDLGRRADDRSLIMLAHAASGVAHFWSGNPSLAVRDSEEVLARYDPASNGSLAYLYGQDPAVAARAYGGCALAQLGRADLGRRWLEESLDSARQRHNPFDVAFASAFAGIFHAVLGQRALTRARAEEGMAVSTEHGFPLWLGVSRLLRGWSVSGQPDEPRAIEEIRLGMMEQVKTGNQAGGPVGMALLAESYLDAGKLRKALGAVEAGLALSAQTGTGAWDAELHRLRGELRLRDDPPAQDDAERCFRRAVEVANGQDMRTFALRSTIRLARLALARGDRDDARTMLARVHASFTDSFDIPDLVEARTLLEQLPPSPDV